MNLKGGNFHEDQIARILSFDSFRSKDIFKAYFDQNSATSLLSLQAAKWRRVGSLSF